MFVVKRDGRKEDVKFDKITSRINKLCYGLDNRFVDSIKISQKVRVVEGLKQKNVGMFLRIICEFCIMTIRVDAWYVCTGC